MRGPRRHYAGAKLVNGQRRRHRPRGTPAPSAPISAVLMGQSEMAYLTLYGATYRTLPQATLPATPNLTLYLQNDTVGVAPEKLVVNAANIAANKINPAMSALSAALAYVAPTKQFVLGDWHVPGTSRGNLADDAETGRQFSDAASISTAMATDGTPATHLFECWYNADAAYIATFKDSFWPFYFGKTSGGATFTLGATHSGAGGYDVDHFIWDGDAGLGAVGRGTFARQGFTWHITTPMPFLDAPVTPTAEMQHFNSTAARLSEPARAVMHALADDALAQSVNVKVGPSAHICRFGGTSTEIHPDTGNKDGQIGLMWPSVFFPFLRAAGVTVNEPILSGISGPTDGSYVDIEVDLPNGGTLTTLSALEGRAAYAGTSPHQQAVTGFEITRANGERRPVMRTTETGYPASHRGTVAIVDTGSGTPRKGKVRITPTTPFTFGDKISYLRGQATASLIEPRDFDLYPYFLLESVAGWRDTSATYPCPGIAVRPYQDDLSAPVPAPPFAARGANFDGTDYFNQTGLLLGATNQGMASFWFRHTGPTWTATRQLIDIRVGSTAVITAITASSNRITFRLNQDGTGSDNFTTPVNTFLVDTWYHVLWAWDYAAGRFQIYVNGVALNTAAYSFTGSTKFDVNGANITQVGFMAAIGGTLQFTGDLAHCWIASNQTLDMSVLANRQKFALGGVPVDLGGDGSIPTGSAPRFYLDGNGASFNNQGTAGALTLTGALTASSTTPSY